MNKKITMVALGAAVATAIAGVATGAGDDEYSATLAGKIDPSKPKNVILFVGDGMGDSEVTSARYYLKGAAGRLNMDKLPFRGSSIHYVLNPGPGPNYTPNYTGDSAPTAVAWSTGRRTMDGRLAQSPSTAANVPGSNEGYETYMEIAKAKGKATGNVSTSEITDATPAGPSAHISQRACHGPADTRTTCATEAKTAGGLGSVAEQIIDTKYDVVLGGGKNRFQQTLAAGGTDTVLDYATTKGYTQQPTDKAGLDAITSLSGGKVLGLFNGGNMTTEFAPIYARTEAYYTANAATIDRSVQGGDPATGSRCVETQRSSTNEPSLAAMTKKAIQLLEEDEDGFTLQVESASIDKRDHAADPCGQIGEMKQLDEAVAAAQAFQKDHPDTLIIVTADHSHTSQIGYTTGKPANGASYATLKTNDGVPMRVVYGTADTGSGATTSGSQFHTGAQVPVWASGPQGANVQGTIDQTDIFDILVGKTPSKLSNGQNGQNGKDGAAGAPGSAGAPGAAGANGTNGAAGQNGVNGTNGPAGPAGAPGANGANGANGINGRDGLVTCKTSGKSVKCTVTYGSASKSSAARLVKNNKTVARGTVSKSGKLTLKRTASVKKGTYTLIARGKSLRVKIG